MSGPALAIRKSAYDGLRRNKQTIVRGAFPGLKLGRWATYETAGGQRWLVATHPKITRVGLSWLGALVANFGAITDDYDVPIDVGFEVDRDLMRAELADAVRPFRVPPRNPDIEAGDPPLADNPWQEVLDDQGAPRSIIQAAASVPEGLTAVSSE